MLCGGDEAGAAGCPEDDGGLVALHEDGGLNGADGGPVLGDDGVELLADLHETARRQELGYIVDDPPGDGADFAPGLFQDGPAGLAQGGIDGQDALCYGGGGVRHWAGSEGRLLFLLRALTEVEELIQRDGPGAKQQQGNGGEDVQPAGLRHGRANLLCQDQCTCGDGEEDDGEETREESQYPKDGNEADDEGDGGRDEMGVRNAIVGHEAGPVPGLIIPQEVVSGRQDGDRVTSEEQGASADAKDGDSLEEGANRALWGGGIFSGVFEHEGVGALGFRGGGGSRDRAKG